MAGPAVLDDGPVDLLGLLRSVDDRQALGDELNEQRIQGRSRARKPRLVGRRGAIEVAAHSRAIVAGRRHDAHAHAAADEEAVVRAVDGGACFAAHEATLPRRTWTIMKTRMAQPAKT